MIDQIYGGYGGDDLVEIGGGSDVMYGGDGDDCLNDSGGAATFDCGSTPVNDWDDWNIVGGVTPVDCEGTDPVECVYECPDLFAE